MKAKEILMYTRPICPPWDEASKNLAYEIARNCQGNFRFHLLCTKDNSLRKDDFISEIELETIFSKATLGWSEKISLLRRLYKVDLGCDIIHFLFTPRALTSVLFRSRLVFSAVKTIQTVATVEEKLFSHPEQLRRILFADLIVAQSRYTQKKLNSAGIDQVKLIYPGIDLEKFYPQPKDKNLLERYNLKEDDFIVLYAGEYTRLKAMDDILGAFEKIFSELKLKVAAEKIKLVLALRIKSKDDLEKRGQVKDRLRKMGYEKKVVFLEKIDDMAKVYNLSDISIFPAREMTGKFDIPFVIIESMACKKPVIITEIPVLQEFIQDRQNGIVIKKADPESLAERIIELFNDSSLRENLAKNGQKMIFEKFNIKKSVVFYQEVYNSLINNFN